MNWFKSDITNQCKMSKSPVTPNLFDYLIQYSMIVKLVETKQQKTKTFGHNTG